MRQLFYVVRSAAGFIANPSQYPPKRPSQSLPPSSGTPPVAAVVPPQISLTCRRIPRESVSAPSSNPNQLPHSPRTGIGRRPVSNLPPRSTLQPHLPSGTPGLLRRR